MARSARTSGATGITALIDFADPQNADGPRLRHAFGQPLQTLLAHTPAQLRPLLDAVQQAAQRGLWCVGSMRYEAAAAFDAALSVHAPDGPLACFAVYDQSLPWPAADPDATAAHATWQPTLQRPAFDAAMATIHAAIQRGDVYQVNFTAPMTGTLAVNSLDDDDGRNDTRALFAALQRAQPGGYAAWLNLGGEQVLSVSPELFFDWNLADALAGQLLARPMKGTAPRGVNAIDDADQAQALRTSPKERAENVMVVDLLRNDMSRVAQPFSVQVPRLFQTQALPSVWQMTSDVTATTRPGCTLADVFSALFPCGSVTGAPKVQAMRIIKALEPLPRGVYCGAVGVVRPVAGGGLHATFNVPIRTVTARQRVLRCSTGSGITADATADGEWREWQHKRAFVERASQPFELLETLALVSGHYRHASLHLARLAGAAVHFGFALTDGAATQALAGLAARHPQGAWRVRLLLDVRGQARAEAFALPASPAQVLLQLADWPLLEAHSEFTRFKTTRRAHYDAFTPTEPGVFDTVLWNAEGEITECTRGNVAMLIDDRWVTPPLHCGLLGGVARALALQSGQLVEAVVRVDDLPRVQGWAFLNSLRGWIGAQKV